MRPPPSAIQDISRSLTPLSSIADSTDEVDRLLTGPVTPERSPANGRGDEESDLSPLTSDDEAVDINATPRPLQSRRTLRPRGTKASTSTMEHATPSTQTLSWPGPSSSVDQSSRTSKKRKRVESLTTKPSPVVQKQKPKLDFYVSEDRCHQCRNRPRYAFMRCTSKDKSGQYCKRLFCVSCIVKRYPTDIDFDPQLKRWKCPFCGDTCNCTKCCFKRHVRYTSTANVKIDQDTLLHYATLMSNNSIPATRPPPPQKWSKSARGSKSTKKPNPRPTREFVKAKSAAENVPPPSKPPTRRRPKEEIIQTAALNSATSPDIESIIRGLADTAAMFEKFGCGAGEYWGVIFSNIDGGRIGVAYVGDKPPDIFLLKDDGDGDRTDEPPPAKRLRISSGAAA